MRGLLLVLCLAGCLDYDALSNGSQKDLSVGDLAERGDGALVAPDLADVELGDQDLAAEDLAGLDLASTPPQLIGTSNGLKSPTTSHSIPPPTGVAQGDVIVLAVWWTDTTSTPVISGKPFTQLAMTSATGQSARWYWRVADADEATVLYTATVQNSVAIGLMAHAFRGASSAVGTPAVARSAASWPASATTTVSQTAVLVSGGYGANSGGWTAPTGFTLIRAALRMVAFLAVVPDPQTISIGMPVSANGVDPLLTEIVLIQPQ